MLASKKNVSLTEGPILANLIKFIVPLMIGGFLQCCYNAADLIVVGNFASENDLAAVGATGPVVGLTINLFVALSVGTSILIARAYGANDEEKIKRLISTSYTFSIILGITIALLGQILAVPLLKLSGCPEGEVFEGAVLYLRITFFGAPAQLFYNFMCNVIRAAGDSKRPLIYLTVSGLVNVVLNLILVIGFGMGAGGVAAATVASIYVSAALLFVKLIHQDGVRRLRPFAFSINPKQLVRIVRLGVPSAISSSMYSIANFQIMAAINAYGAYATAGNAAATNIETFFTTMTASLATGMSVFVGQNVGAKKKERVSLSIKRMYLFSAPVVGSLGLLAPIFGRQLLALYTGSATGDAVEFGIVRLWCVSAFLALNVFMNVNSGTLQAFGYTTYSMIISVVGICGFRTLWMSLIYPMWKTPIGLYSCFTVSWFLVAIVGSVTVAVLLSRYKKDKLKL